MTKDEVREIIYKILEKKFNIDSKCLLSENNEKSLLGNPFNIGSIYLVYFLIICEQYFKISFIEEDLLDYNFDSIDKICSRIVKKRITSDI